MPRPDELFAEVASRLRALAARPNYRFKRTSRAAAARYLEGKTKFLGFSETEIRAVEAFAGASLPEMYRTFLTQMGRSSGDLFCGIDLPGPSDFPTFRRAAEALLAEEGLQLPPPAVVISNHQGCGFAYVEAGSVPDGPVWTFVEGEPSPAEAASSFAEFVTRELAALERAHEGSLAAGGFFRTVYPDGSGRQEYPSRDSGIRPLDFADDFLD